MNPAPHPPVVRVLGVPIDAVDYRQGLDRVLALSQLTRPSAVSACNTHLVAHARSDRVFFEVMRRFDLVLPDGMPLIWSMRHEGYPLQDRVYGPYFMRHVIAQTPAPARHFFFGGSEDCLRELAAEMHKIQPELCVAGTLSPPFRKWTEEDEVGFAKEIQEANADFIWVALGGGRQEHWIIENQKRHSRGVFFAVGDAFELLAGRRPFAPSWMQKRGLTWVYRLLQEPQRLWKRYFKYNSLFIYYSMRDRLFPPGDRGLPAGCKIAFLGCRGVPARYAGFETVVEQLGARLAARGCWVVVFNRPLLYPERPREYRGMQLLYVPTIRLRAVETFLHTMLSLLALLNVRPDVVYLCGVGNALLAAPLRLAGIKVIANVDGIDFKRSKWRGFAQHWLRWSERWVTRLAHRVVADNLTVVEHYEEHYGFTPDYLAYGADPDVKPVSAGELARLGIKSREYILIVGRLSSENQVDLLLRAYAQARPSLPLVVVGGANYENAYETELRELAVDGVIFAGPVYGDGYRELSQNCRFFVLPATIEATRLVLLDQMAFGNAVLFQDCAATREVIADAGQAFDANYPEEALAEALLRLAADPAYCRELGGRALARVREHYDWDRVTDRYLTMLNEIGCIRETAPLGQKALKIVG